VRDAVKPRSDGAAAVNQRNYAACSRPLCQLYPGHWHGITGSKFILEAADVDTGGALANPVSDESRYESTLRPPLLAVHLPIPALFCRPRKEETIKGKGN
jgi:hypothetical protein